MRSRHQVLQDSISHVRPLLKKACNPGDAEGDKGEGALVRALKVRYHSSLVSLVA